MRWKKWRWLWGPDTSMVPGPHTPEPQGRLILLLFFFFNQMSSMNSICPAFLIFGALLKFEYRTVKLEMKVGWDLPSGNISSAGAFSAFRPNKRGLNLGTEQDTWGSFCQSALKWNQHLITYSTEGDLTKLIGKNTSVCNRAMADTWMSKPGIISSSKSGWKIICSITLIIKAIASLMGLFLNTAMKSLTDFFFQC